MQKFKKKIILSFVFHNNSEIVIMMKIAIMMNITNFFMTTYYRL
jgi:hypothetical protein